jgi:hypothetical protein
VQLEATAAVPVAQLAQVKPGELFGGLSQVVGPAAETTRHSSLQAASLAASSSQQTWSCGERAAASLAGELPTSQPKHC